MKKKVLLLLFSIIAIGLLCNFALADTNPDDNWDDSLDYSGSPWEIILSVDDHVDTCRWGNVFAGSEGWSDDHYVLTDWPGGGLEIHCYDCCMIGDFYSVWIVDTATDTTVCKVFTTPEVEVGPYPPIPGSGTTLSDGTHYMYLAAGTYEFKVRDEFFHVLWDLGYDPRDYSWSPAGFWIGFHEAPHIIPEVPLGTVMSAVAMIVGLIAFTGMRARRRP